MSADQHAGWRSRGYLPHFDSPDAVQHIIFRLAGALPAEVMAEIAALPVAQRMSEVDAGLDQAHGEPLLAAPDVAAIVERALLHFDGERYRLLAWCVMPTHVHALVAQVEGHRLSAVAHAWKSFTANAVNKALGRKGALWAREYCGMRIRWQRRGPISRPIR